MPFIYLAGIVLFLVIGLVIYLVVSNKEKKRLKMLMTQQIDDFSAQQLKTEPIQQPYELRVASPVMEKAVIVDPQFELFKLEPDERPTPTVVEEDDYEDDDLEKKFAEYQKFLRENLDLEDEEVELSKPGFRRTLGNEYEEDNLNENDFRRFRERRTNTQLSDLMEELSPQAREIFMSDIMARREFDDAMPEPTDIKPQDPQDGEEG